MEKSKTALIEAIREYPSGDIYDTDAAVSIGSMAEADIALPEGAGEINISLHPGRIYVFSGEANVNGNLITQGSAPVMAGDAMLIGGVLFTVKTGGIEIRGSAQSVNLRKRLTPEGRMDMSAFPAFRRPPRIVRSLPEKSIEIALPPAKEKAPKGQLLKTILPPLIMVMLTVTVSLISKGGIYVIVMAAGMGVTVIFSITNYFSEKKERKEKEAKRTEKYRAYLLGKRKEIYAAQKEEAESRRYMSPSLADIAGMTDDYSSRLYERTPFDDDFLSVTLGASEISPLTCVLVAEEDMLKEADELADEAKGAADNFMALKDMPTPVNLRNAHIGLVGERREIAPVLKSITAQLSFLHSYDDMQILIVTAEENAAEFAYARWLPHMSLRAVNVTGLVAGESAKEQIIGSLSQILKDRKTRKDEGNKVSLYSPHYVLIIDDPRLISGHSIEEYLKDRDSALGLSLIWTTNMRESLPENIGTVITLEGGGRAVLALDEYVPKRTEIRLYDTDSVNFAMLARKLAPIIHDKGASSRIPEQVSYFDMYGIKSPKELALEKLWSRADSAKSLAVPLGERAAGDTVYLDLHERAHGPHGLVAGTTGSGKSEVLQSYILSLACHFSPHEVGFLLIDYKGGGMANLFDGLPHLLGTITNLDGGESMRALASIKSELKRRQSIFAEAGVNNINLYTKAYKRGEASLPLPHLFIISDEFAELKKEQPDFMAELVSTARIGRTLGVHLILATQKPSGVVDDQIWSNSRFKIALKVQNTSDSNEVLHTPDAASITQPGRCYLQVGNNEIYELFQSAFSGASYSEEEAGTGYDKRIWRINDLGQGELINEDLSATVKDESKATQLDVIVNHIAEVHKALGMEEVEKPWLPPLESSVVNPNFEAETKPRKDDEGADLAVPIGVVDLPDMQAQREYIHSFGKDGNFAIFGSSGFGKSVMLTDIILTLAQKNSPEEVNLYILDFGNSALIPLKKLAHAADYMTYDSDEKLEKFMRVINAEMDERKRLFAHESAQSFAMYNEVAEKKLPALIIAVDNFDVLKEIGLETDVFFARVTRDGPGIGIYVITSANTSSSIRYNIMAGFKNKASFFQYDDGELRNLIGRSEYRLPEVRGRALVNYEGVNVMQAYLPVLAETEREYVGKLNALIDGISGRYEGQAAKSGVAMLPDKVTMADLSPETAPPRMIPIGLDAETVTPAYLDMKEGLHLIVGKPKSGKSNVLKIILSGIKEGRKFVCDTSALELRDYAKDDRSLYIYGEDGRDEFFRQLKEAVEAREAAFKENGGDMLPREYYRTLEPVSLVIDDAENFIKVFASVDEDMKNHLERFIYTGGSIFASARGNGLRGYEKMSSLFRETQRGIALGAPSEQQIFQVNIYRAKAEIAFGYICGYGDPVKVKMPKL